MPWRGEIKKMNKIEALDILNELEDIVSRMKPPRPFGAEITRAELDNMFDDIREYISFPD